MIPNILMRCFFLIVIDVSSRIQGQFELRVRSIGSQLIELR